jgi:hypothetical protein
MFDAFHQQKAALNEGIQRSGRQTIHAIKHDNPAGLSQAGEVQPQVVLRDSPCKV